MPLLLSMIEWACQVPTNRRESLALMSRAEACGGWPWTVFTCGKKCMLFMHLGTESRVRETSEIMKWCYNCLCLYISSMSSRPAHKYPIWTCIYKAGRSLSHPPHVLLGLPILVATAHPMPHHAHLLLRYQLNASCMTLGGNGVGTSAYFCRATGCRRYTAAQMFWLTSR